METPLTLLEFARRARKIHTQREAVVDGDLRLIYGAFFERTDRWSSARAHSRRAAGRRDDRAHRGRARLAVTHVYGLTETAPFITVCEGRPKDAQLAARELAAAKARQGVELITSGELRVVDEEERDVPRDGRTLGEIVARGNVVMKGYWNDPEASAKALRGGWFRSGDAAVVHADGYVEIRDRYKDVIIAGGENISPSRWKAPCSVIRRCSRLRSWACPHEKWGEAPQAFVVLRPEANATPAEKFVLRVGRSGISRQ